MKKTALFAVASMATLLAGVQARAADAAADGEAERTKTVEELTAEDHSEDQAAGQIAVLRKAIISLDELVGDDDQPLPYSDELRDQLLGITYVRIALLRTYLTAITKAKSGN